MAPRPRTSRQLAVVTASLSATVAGQERCTPFEYRVVAVNKSGLGKPSGIVTVTL